MPMMIIVKKNGPYRVEATDGAEITIQKWGNTLDARKREPTPVPGPNRLSRYTSLPFAGPGETGDGHGRLYL